MYNRIIQTIRTYQIRHVYYDLLNCMNRILFFSAHPVKSCQTVSSDFFLSKSTRKSPRNKLFAKRTIIPGKDIVYIYGVYQPTPETFFEVFAKCK